MPGRLLLALACSGCFFSDPGPPDGGPDGTTASALAGACVWERLASGAAPPAREGPSLTLDAARGVLVLYGGGPSGEPLGDTWEHDGAAWRAARDPGPGPRRGHAAAYDGARAQVVVFGGERGGEVLDDTWTRDADGWRRSAASGPSRRTGAALAGHAGSARLVLFGGLDERDAASDETWLWDGDAWARARPTAAPSPRFAARVAADPESGALLLYGGCGEPSCARPLRDTWAWDGGAWTLRAAGGSGPAVAALVVEDGLAAVLRRSGARGERWAGDGWVPLDGAAPLADGFVAAAHPRADGVVAFGGTPGSAGETWAYRCGPG